MTHKLKVPDTSRLVLELAVKVYDSPLELAYIDAIDFTETSRFFRDFSRSYPPAAETFYYRKWAVREAIRHRMEQFPVQQVLLLGAGLDPLSLYLLEHYPGRISRILEVDNGYIEEKKKIYEEILHITGPLYFLQCDLHNLKQLEVMLKQHGYVAEEPAIIIFEGMLPYMSNEEWVQIMQLLMTPQQHHQCIFDFLLARSEIPDSYLVYYRNALNVLESYVNTTYNSNTRQQIRELVARMGRLERIEPLHEIEKKLMGENRLFHQPDHGILEMAIFNL
ncbi:class I SAM-dependent methyltransferase [Chitinophaga varians]|uniref:class I SAM-dependent methyltransferase n=1 Tax=Chitinophaga varians TaxID=2202339 RepID=UPI00165F70F0|nr:class I SAM-dependent methyltransferase [Chitinophaga varians]MBC9912011.1 class I SAM-dependent methyltransferase [Chitinophaga varians]